MATATIDLSHYKHALFNTLGHGVYTCKGVPLRSSDTHGENDLGLL